MASELKVNWIARVCHEASRAWRLSHEPDVLVLPWDDTPEEVCEVVRFWVRRVLESDMVTGSELHEEFYQAWGAACWSWGPEHDPAKKLNPVFDEWEHLEGWLQANFNLFVAIVRSLDV